MSRPVIDRLEFLFLGTGTSAGVPIIGCRCDVCRSSDPRDRRLRTSACLRFRDGEGQTRVVLLDASPDLREQALRHELDRCDAIVFTHSHFDHTFGLDEVRRFNAVMGQSIDIWAEDHTLGEIRSTFRHIFDAESNVNRSFVASLVETTIDASRPIHLHGLRLSPLRLWHGRLPVLGYRIEALDAAGQPAVRQPAPLPLAYCTDVSMIPDETWSQLAGVETLVLDMLRPTSHPTHFSVDEALDAARRIGASSTWFVHMTHDIGHAAWDATLPAGMALAFDGLVLGSADSVDGA